jgi:hypothetical protein
VSTRIGLAVGATAVRAVAVRASAVTWAAEVPVEGKTLAEALTELFATVPTRRWPRPTISAAVGPTYSQLRRLTGLPAVRDDEALTRLVGESASRFFLRNGVPLVTTGVHRDSENGVWGAAIERPVVSTLESCCAERRYRLTAILPSLVVLPHGLEGDSLMWRDGDVVAELSLLEGDLRGVRRAISCDDVPDAEHAVAPNAVAALTELGEHGWRFADAYGAAVGSVRTPLAYRPSRATRAAKAPPWRLAVAAAALTLGVFAALLAPVFSARESARLAVAALSGTAGQRRAAEAAETELAVVTGALREVATFDRDRRSATLLLASVTRALPRGGALVNMRTDSTGGTIVALVPRAAPFVESLEHVPLVATPSIIGPITREVANTTEVERVTVRFHWADLPATSARTSRQR